jgi:hypothetical protein
MRKTLGWLLAITVLLLLAAEAMMHIGRVNDFPLYDANNRIGYIPKPNQSGSLMWSRDWATNELSMGTERPFRPSPAPDLLLVGDSIVFGGHLDQSEHLAPALERETGWTVWPISAGSWGLQNELTYLADHPEVVAGVDRIAFVLNRQDFDEPSSFRSDFTHPRTKPFPALPYVARRALGLYSRGAPSAGLQVPKHDALAMLANFARQQPVDVFLYPHKDAVGQECRWAPSALRSMEGVRIHCIDGNWTRSAYHDVVHPTAEGTSLLATLMAASLKREEMPPRTARR